MREQVLEAIIRFRVSDDEAFLSDAHAVMDLWREADGCLGVKLVRNIDEPTLWALLATFGDVGSYRRAFGGYKAKIALHRLMMRAIDEPSAYLAPDFVRGPTQRDRDVRPVLP